VTLHAWPELVYVGYCFVYCFNENTLVCQEYSVVLLLIAYRIVVATVYANFVMMRPMRVT